MGRLEFGAAVTVKTTPDRAFEYFADYHHVAQVLDGVRRWEPVGNRSRGVGARYRVEMTALGLPLRSVLRLDRWRPPEEIGWVSESGLIKQEGRFHFRRAGEGVRIELRIAYEPPGFAVGTEIARRLDPMVRARLQRALERVRDLLES
ncbi:MAG TPA: SRPBCC family protein [Candidatus Dormibacteraeota bacterium]|nr:SRPBCC family protein [Candidatus Dormibacteraeota bacterium]